MTTNTSLKWLLAAAVASVLNPMLGGAILGAWFILVAN